MSLLIRPLKFVVVALVAFLECASAHATGLNDISILLPLPKSDIEVAKMIRPESRSHRFFALETVNELGNPEGKQDLMWRLIAIRLDPCFFETGAPNACRHQIRLVWQPLFKHGRDWLTRDQAMHTFYDFDDAEWAQLITDWSRRVPQTSKGLPLGVHPLLKEEGYVGHTWPALHSLLNQYCDEQHLTRVTASFANNVGTVWTFSGVNIDADGSHHRIDIAKTPAHTQHQEFSADLNELGEFFSRLSPAPLNEAFWTRIVRHSVGARATLSEPQIFDALSRSYEFENPRHTNPGNTDCASCHIAQTVRLWGDRHFPEWNASAFGENYFVSSIWNLQNLSPNASFPNRVRAFGYFLDEPAVSQRVINETAHVLESGDLLGASAVDADHGRAIRTHF